MKKKIALLLAAAMTVSALPMTAFASSTNSINKVANVKEDEEIRSGDRLLALNIVPKDDIETGDSIVVDINNGEFDWSLFNEAAYETEKGESWDTFFNYIESGATYATAFNKFLYQEGSRYLPYQLKYVSKSEIEIILCPTYGLSLDSDNSGSGLTQGKPAYNIYLPAKATDEGDVTISVDSNDTTISNSSSITIAKTSTSSGSTTASVSSSDVKNVSSDIIDVPDITVKEDTTKTFPQGTETGTIKFKVNGKFEWKTLPVLTSGTGCTDDFVITADNYTDSYVEYKITGDLFDSSKLSSLVLTGGTVEVNDSDRDYGDISITVSGSSSGVTTQTIVVATRQDYGFSLTTLDAVPTIFSGRIPLDEDGNANDLDEDDFKTAKFRFSETTPDTWLTSRKLEFTVPQGVKIIGADIDKTKYISGGTGIIEQNLAVVNTGSALRISALGDNVLNKKESSYVDIALYVTAEATFTGDITVSASGAGLDADTLSPVTIAKAVAPVTIETSATSTNLGYQATPTADITITEAAPGALKDKNDVTVKMDTVYGNNELGFASDSAELSVDGDLVVKDFKITSGEMKFKVDSESYNNPATITIKNVQVGTTRSIPYGSYDLLIAGASVVNNYKKDVDQKSTVDSTNGIKPTDFSKTDGTDDFGFFDTDEGFKYKGYLNVVTETGTLDGKVEVTIGEKVIKIDGKEVEIDVAPYIQTSSNSTMVPVRFVALAIGVDQEAASDVTSADDSSKVLWDANSKTCTIIYAAGNGMKIIKFQAGSDQMVIDGTSVTMAYGVVAEIVDGRMFVPFRALGQALGVNVTWDDETRTATYNG